MSRTHTLKCDAKPFGAVWDGTKRAEIRFNDRGFQVGDVLVLRETEGLTGHGEPVYTGREIMAPITHMQGGYGLQETLVVLSLRVIARETKAANLATEPKAATS